MEKGKNKVEPILDEEERRWHKALHDFDIITEQFRSLIQKMNEWLQQHQESNEQAEETQAAPVGEESASVLLARATELSDTLWRFERELDDDDDCEASTSGSGLATDPEESLVEPKPEAPSADPKPEPSSP